MARRSNCGEFWATSIELGRDPEFELQQFLGAGADQEQFWEQVDANFAAGRIKMVFVADTIPRELARIVEFLNEQMKADVRAVELTWFEGEGITALAPRIIGETERAQNEKAARSALPKISRQEWIEESLRSFGTEAIEAANHYVDLIAAAGGHAEVTRAQASLIAVFDLPEDTIYPITLSRQGKGSVQLCLAYLMSRPAFANEAVRQHLYDELTAIVGPLSTSKLSGYPGFPLTRLNDPAVRRDLQALLVAIREKAAFST